MTLLPEQACYSSDDIVMYVYWSVCAGFALCGICVALTKGWFSRFGIIGRAKRKRQREVNARVALFIGAGLSEYEASNRAASELAAEAKAVLE